MPLKEVGTRILGVPWDPLGESKIIKKSKKLTPKIDEKSEGFKRACQSRFRPIWGGQKLQNEVKNDSEMILENKKTDFCKSAYFIRPCRCGKAFEILKKHQKSIKLHSENGYTKQNAL